MECGYLELWFFYVTDLCTACQRVEEHYVAERNDILKPSLADLYAQTFTRRLLNRCCHQVAKLLQ